MREWLLGLGLGVTLTTAASALDYAPIDCARAQTAAEQAVCRSYALGQAEARMATLFGIATSLVAMGQRGDIRDAQRAFLEARTACGDNTACLTELYARRIRALDQVIADIASRGPF